jgi:hypothetical protein
MKETLHVLTICTGTYKIFINEFIYSLTNIKNFNINLHILTDDTNYLDENIKKFLEKNNIIYNTYFTYNMPYRYAVLFKFHFIVQHTINIINENSKFIFVDIDSKFISDIPNDINHYKLCFNRSSWVAAKFNVDEKYNYIENHNISDRNILVNESDKYYNFIGADEYYCQSSFIMGTYKYLIELNLYMMNIIAKQSYYTDIQIPILHDQTLINCYVRDNINNNDICYRCYCCNVYDNDMNKYDYYKNTYNECFIMQKFCDLLKKNKKNSKIFEYHL